MPTATVNDSELKKLLADKTYASVPKEGDIVKGTIIAISPREILIDLPEFKSGIVRGLEAREIHSINPELKIGDEVEATIVELENEEGRVELSLRHAGVARLWERGFEVKAKKAVVEGKVTDANRGGLMISWTGMKGFMPVSQLSPEHYPRVPGGDKGKILERLRSFVGQTMRLQIIDADPKQDKLIFSEKTLWEDEQKDLIANFKIGDIVEGKVTAIADFGVFVGFDGLEGLVHISEIAWQRIDNPADLIKVGQEVRARVLNIQGSKIFLSMKDLQEDPWKRVHERYAVGQKVQGKVLKVNPFGLFVELDPDIHGLAHVSELNIQPGVPPEEQIKSGDQREFKIVSIEPEHHRLGLSEKALQKGPDNVPKQPPVAQEQSNVILSEESNPQAAMTDDQSNPNV